MPRDINPTSCRKQNPSQQWPLYEMVLNRASTALRIAGYPISHCSGCHVAVLRSLLSTFVAPTARNPTFTTGQLQKLSTTAPRYNLAENAITQVAEASVSRPISNESPQRNRVESNGDHSLPWYLREAQPTLRQIELPDELAERQKLPDLPPHAPPVLQPLLEHLSVDIGLDDLHMLDLRRIDPPPALGANLIMIIGNARSEKHLHTSADRLCRWLRSTYKLRPDADGLLGRNELKLKLKRRARAMKMLANVNATERLNKDNGINTDWVCVNVGQVEPAEGTPKFVPPKPGFVGFGSQTNKVTLVVQMFTEEKRAEMNLEGLWNTVQKIKDREKADREAESPEPELATEVDTDLDSPEAQELVSALSQDAHAPSRRAMKAYKSVQTRGFHDNAHLKTASAADAVPSLWHTEIRSITENANSPSQNTKELLHEIQSVRSEDALKNLGRGAEDFASTSFLSQFYRSIPLQPQTVHWECLAEMYLHAAKLGHSGYSAEHMSSLLSRIQLSTTDISENVFLAAFKAMLIPLARSVSVREPYKHYFTRAVRVLELMENYGYDPLSPQIVVCLDEAFTPASTNSSDDPLHDEMVSIHDQLHDVVDDASVTPLDEHFYKQLLSSCARLNHWRGFWNIWHGMARRSLARSGDLYRLAFSAVARSGHQHRCLAALRSCVPQMRREEPVVQLYDASLAEAIQKCILVAEPEIQVQAGSAGSGKEEFVPLWRACEAILTNGRARDLGNFRDSAEQLENPPLTLSRNELGSLRIHIAHIRKLQNIMQFQRHEPQ